MAAAKARVCDTDPAMPLRIWAARAFDRHHLVQWWRAEVVLGPWGQWATSYFYPVPKSCGRAASRVAQHQATRVETEPRRLWPYDRREQIAVQQAQTWPALRQDAAIRRREAHTPIVPRKILQECDRRARRWRARRGCAADDASRGSSGDQNCFQLVSPRTSAPSERTASRFPIGAPLNPPQRRFDEGGGANRRRQALGARRLRAPASKRRVCRIRSSRSAVFGKRNASGKARARSCLTAEMPGIARGGTSRD